MNTSTSDKRYINEAIILLKSSFKMNIDRKFSPVLTDFADVESEEFRHYVSNEYIASHTGLINKKSTLPGPLNIIIEEMSQGEVEGMEIRYSFMLTPFGTILLASTNKGICRISFVDKPQDAINDLKLRFAGAVFKRSTDELQKAFKTVFYKKLGSLTQIRLHLQGSEFQLKVWKYIVDIPVGWFVTYEEIATAIGQPTATQAVGTAVGSNPVAMVIPCHRVVPKSGGVGNYHYGKLRKMTLIAWESFLINRKCYTEGNEKE